MLVWALSSQKIASQLQSKPAPHTPKAQAMAPAALRPRHQLREKAREGVLRHGGLHRIASWKLRRSRRCMLVVNILLAR